MTSCNPFQEHFYATNKIIFRRCSGRVRVWSGLRTDNGENRRNTNECKFKKTMPMQCAWWHEMRCITRTKSKTTDKNPTTKEVSYSITEKGKSRSYEYGKLYPGRYNTPPLREDLVPRSRMAPERSGRGRAEEKLSCFFDKWVKPQILRGWAIRDERDCKQSVRKEEQGTLR